MLRTIGLWRAVVNRSRADRSVVTAAFVLLVCAITLVATGALYGDTVALGGLRRAVLDAPAADRAVVVRTSAGVDDIPALDAVVREQLTDAISPTGGDVALVARSASLAPAGLDSTAARDRLTVLASFEDLDRHATLTAGRWPVVGRDPLEATLSEGAAAALGLKVGDRVELSRSSSGPPIGVEVVGLWRPVVGDTYFLGDRLDLTGVRTEPQLTTRGPFVVALADLQDSPVGRDLTVEWRGIPSIDGLLVERVDALHDGIDGLKPRLRAALPRGRDIAVLTGLPAILADVSRSILVSRSGVTLLTIQFAVLAGYAVLLVAGLLVERRRSETALLRSRGATSVHLVALAFGEALLLAVPAAILAPFLAVGAVRLIGSIGPLADTGVIQTAAIDGRLLAVTALAGSACVVALTLPALTMGGLPLGIRASLGRPVGRTMAQRLGIDLVLVALAAVALWQLHLYGAPLTHDAHGVLGIDPLLVAAPAIGLLAGAVLCTRLVPRLAEIGERVAGRRRGIVPPLGSRQVARRPLRYTRSALLLVLAAALGTFAAASAATFARSQVDQAAYQAAGDARVTISDYPDLPAWAIGPADRAVPGVTAATPVDLASLEIGRTVRDGRLLAVDPAAVQAMIKLPPDDGPTPALLDELVAARPTTTAVAIPGEPRRLGLTVDADLSVNADDSGGTEVPTDWDAVGLTVVVQDADGRLHRIDGGTMGPKATGQRIEVPLWSTIDGLATHPVYPLRLVGLELALSPPTNLVMNGSVELTGLSESPAEAGADWTPVDFEPGAAGWSWSRTAADGTTPYRPPAGSPGRIEAGLGDDASPAIFGSFDRPGAIYRLTTSPSGDGILPAIAGDRLLALTGARIGDTIAVTSEAHPITVRIIGSTASFPPLDPESAFLVVDGATLGLLTFSATDYPATADEWWLSLDPAGSDAAVATLRTAPYSASEIVQRDELSRALAGDPVWLGVVGVLALGAVAAIVFAAIGFIVSATVTTDERLGELALLRALGLSQRQLSTWLTIEQVFLLTVGLIGGSALGLLLAWLVLPYSTLSASGAAVIPAPVIVVPWESILPVYAVTVAILIGAVLVLARRMPASSVTGILRAGGE